MIARANNGRYTNGSMIAIYGKYTNWRDHGLISPGGAGDNARDPSSMAVANALGVRYAPNATDVELLRASQAPSQSAEEEAPPTADPQAAPADTEFDGGLTEEDWEAAFDELQEETGQGGQQEKRHEIPNRRLRKRAPSASSLAIYIFPIPLLSLTPLRLI